MRFRTALAIYALLLALLLTLFAVPVRAQGATPARADSLVQAAATYDNSRTPMTTGGMLLNRDSIVVVEDITVEQYIPEHVDSLWAVVQKCSGVQAPAGMLESLTFSAVPGDAFWVHRENRDNHESPDIGFSVMGKGNILIVKKYMNRPELVEHEMLHTLLYLTGTVVSPPWHDTRYFNPCGLQGQ